MCGFCLDLDLNKLIVKIFFRGKCGNLSIDQILDDVEVMLLIFLSVMMYGYVFLKSSYLLGIYIEVFISQVKLYLEFFLKYFSDGVGVGENVVGMISMK